MLWRLNSACQFSLGEALRRAEADDPLHPRNLLHAEHEENGGEQAGERQRGSRPLPRDRARDPEGEQPARHEQQQGGDPFERAVLAHHGMEGGRAGGEQAGRRERAGHGQASGERGEGAEAAQPSSAQPGARAAATARTSRADAEAAKAVRAR